MPHFPGTAETQHTGNLTSKSEGSLHLRRFQASVHPFPRGFVQLISEAKAAHDSTLQQISPGQDTFS